MSITPGSSRSQARHDHVLPALIVHNDDEPGREHRCVGRSCWCGPEIRRVIPRRWRRRQR